MTTAYLGLDFHASTCTLGVMKTDGTFLGHERFLSSIHFEEARRG